MEVSDASPDLRGWTYAIAAGGACIFGATVVFWDIILRKIPFVGGGDYGDISHSARFQVASMSLGAGVLLFSALRNLVPQAENYFDSPLIHHTIRNAGGLITIACFFLGAALCVGLSDLIHRYTPENIVHCGDHGGDQDQDKVSRDFDEDTVESADDSQNTHTPGSDRSRPVSGRPTRTTSLTHTATRDGTGSRGHECSLGYTRDHALDLTRDALRPVNSTSMRPGSRALSHADASSKQRRQHYHQDCGRSGVCAGYTAPCFSAACVCDGHEVTRTAWSRSLPSQKGSLDDTNLDRSVPQLARLSRSTLGSTVDLEANEQTPLFGTAQHQLAGGSSPREVTDSDERSDLSHSHHGDPPVHHHHHNDDSSKMLRIGISTAIAICLHKAPEGFITFISAHADRQLGLTLFLAIALHNVSEGAVIAYPLLVATGSRTKAFVWASLLGGLSGPLGALVGFILTRSGFLHRDDSWTPIVYGTLFAIVAGFMSTIAIQSMLPAAIKEDKTNTRATTIWFSIGVGIIALAGALTK